jgi:tryptophan 7-halogenase
VNNVVAIGNSGGFVEPLEATGLMLATAHAETLTTMLQETALEPTDSVRKLYNDVFVSGWDEIRDFLGLHYRLNTRLQTPFWKRCQNDVDLCGAKALLEFYHENGPIRMCGHRIGGRGRAFGVHNAFGVEGHLVILTGCKVPYSRQYQPTDAEWNIWRRHKADLTNVAQQALSVEQSLQCVRLPAWQWHADIRPRSNQ